MITSIYSRVIICVDCHLDNRIRTKMNHNNTLPIYQKCFNKHRLGNSLSSLYLEIIRLIYHFQSKSLYSQFIFVNYLNCWTLIRYELHLSQKYISNEDIAKYAIDFCLQKVTLFFVDESISKSVNISFTHLHT